MKTKEEKLQLLKETVEWYSEDPKGRRCIVNGVFKYGGVSEGCAVGRLMTPEERKLLDDNDVKGLVTIEDFLKLPTQVQEWGKTFLRGLQTLHDTTGYWDYKGKRLTIYGQVYVSRLKNHIISGKA